MIGGKRVFECIIEAYPSTYTKDERMARRAELRFDSRSCTLSFVSVVGGEGRGEKEKKKRELLER